MELQPASRALTNSLNQFNASADQSRRFINVLAAGSQAGAGDINYLSQAIEKSGTTANLMGLEFEQLVALIETAAPKFSEAAVAGNSIDKVLMEMKAKQIGYRNGVFDVNAALDELAGRFAKGELAANIFGKEHAKMVEVLVDGREEFVRYQEAVTGTNKAIEQAATNTDTNDARLKQSSGASRTARPGTVGSCYAPGCCHAFTADGRCVSLLKVLMTNCCSFDCGYCVNRRSNDIPRATFAPRELAELTMEFYRRNYIEGLFLSSAVLGTPDYTTERMLAVLRLLRGEYRFGGYIHAKAIPGTSPELVQQLGYLADRLSVNVELPSERSLNLLAPDKGRHSIFRPMKQIAVSGAASREELTLYRHAPKFAPAGQSTQMIVGASPETDYHILKLTEGMYHKYGLKRVFYSAYIPVAEDTRLPALDTKPPLLREHRLYQADWLLRFYQFEADEILDKDNPNFNPYLDPKCNWAVQHYGLFPVDVNRAPFEMLLRVPGIGPKSARRIWRARKQAALGLDELKRMGVVLKRAQYFITCRGFSGAHPGRGSAGRERITRALIDPNVFSGSCEQLSLFSPPAVDNLIGQGVPPRTAVRMVREEAVQCLAKAL